jgi:hypothetical protein
MQAAHIHDTIDDHRVESTPGKEVQLFPKASGSGSFPYPLNELLGSLEFASAASFHINFLSCSRTTVYLR